MNFATWSIRNPVPVSVLFILLSLAGLRGFQQLSIQDLPDLDLPTVNVSLLQPGAAPAQLETEVARKVEDSLATLDGLKHLYSTVADGQVQIVVEFVLGKPLSDALAETKDAVDRVRSDLPDDLLEPAVSSVTINGSPMLTYAVASTRMDEEALSWFVDDRIAKALLAVPGVGRVERVGGVQREVRIEVDPVRLAALGVTAVDVSRAVRSMQQESSGGRGQLGAAEQSVRTIATVRQASEMAALPITVSNGRHVRLDQVATVRDSVAERTQAARLDANPVVGFNVFRAKGFDETRIEDGVKQALEELRARDGSIAITYINGTVEYTREQFQGSMDMLYEGALLAVLVVWWFLRDWRATLVAAAALPLSILPTFAVMSWLGYSLNTLTLLALAVIVGVLVDDAIVEIENIERHRRMGKARLRATGDAVTEIALAVIATTLTLVVVFMPTAFMSGVPGLLFRQFGWTVVVAVLASLLVARLLTPMLAACLLGAHVPPVQPDGALMTRYLHAVRWCLNHRRATLMMATGFFLGSLALLPFIPAGILPVSDRSVTTIDVELPPGSSLDDTAVVAASVRESVMKLPGVRGIFTTLGNARNADDEQTVAETRRGSLTVLLTARGERNKQSEIERDIRRILTEIPGARFTVGGGDGPGKKFSLILASDDARMLKATAQTFERQLRAVGQLANINSTASLERPEIVIRPDLQRAAERGVDSETIGETVRIATSGDFDARLAKLNLDTRQLGIRVRVADSVRKDLDAIGNLRVNGRAGQVPLASVATLSVESGPSQIDRYDRRRYVTINADLGGMPLSEALKAAEGLPIMRAMPPGVAVINTGDAEIAAELASGFSMAMLTGLSCMFCVLVLLFKDFLQPVTILSAIPLSLGGAFIALLVARSELDVPSAIGVVMLMGIVTKNSILLVEYAVIGRRERGLSSTEALVDACHKRARPIVMTTLAMIAGMLPIALGFGADASFRQPMATAVIGGLITSTALSLLVVPVVFTYVDGAERRIKRLFERPVASTGRPLADRGAS